MVCDRAIFYHPMTTHRLIGQQSTVNNNFTCTRKELAMNRFLQLFSRVAVPFILMLSTQFLLPASAPAQVTTASIQGTILDEKGVPAPDVELVARNMETGYYQTTYSSETGKYR